MGKHTVKTYHVVNRENASLSFGISRMEDIYQKRKGIQDEPHRHDFFTVLLVSKGSGRHIIDFSQHSLDDQQIYFIHPGQIHQLIETEPSVGFSIVFSSGFLAQNNISPNFIKELQLFNSYGDAPPLNLSASGLAQLNAYAEAMLALDHSNQKYRLDAIGAYLKLLLIRCTELCTEPPDSSQMESGNALLMQFKDLLEQNFREWHSVHTYAQALHVTSDHLNRVIKGATGNTVKEHIQSRIVVAAKRMLFFSDASTKEIGYQLGFSEPANFSAFFKKCTGLSPSQFTAKV